MGVLNPSAVVIVDYERFRPSTPLPKIGTSTSMPLLSQIIRYIKLLLVSANLEIPVLLVRADDLDSLPDDREVQELWLAPNNQVGDSEANYL